jgi:hypothetical protein
MMARHLSDEEFAEALAGGEPEHLAGCAQCRAELERAGAALGAWRRESLAEAHGRAASRIRVPVRVPAWRPAPAWWAAGAAAALAVVLASDTAHLRTAAPPAGEAGSKQQIEQDNALLTDINAELRWQQGGAVQMPAMSLRARPASQAESE